MVSIYASMVRRVGSEKDVIILILRRIMTSGRNILVKKEETERKTENHRENQLFKP